MKRLRYWRGELGMHRLRLHGSNERTTHVHGLISRPGTELGERGGGAMRRWLAAKHGHQLMPTRGVRAVLGGNTHGCPLSRSDERGRERKRHALLPFCACHGTRDALSRRRKEESARKAAHERRNDAESSTSTSSHTAEVPYCSAAPPKNRTLDERITDG